MRPASADWNRVQSNAIFYITLRLEPPFLARMLRAAMTADVSVGLLAVGERLHQSRARGRAASTSIREGPSPPGILRRARLELR
jgi:hypothetical protein